MSDISLCPHCNAYIDSTQNPETCNACGKSLVSAGAGVGASGQNRAEAPPADSSERDHVRCPTCNDLVSTRYRPVTCYKCGPISVDPNSLPKPQSVDIPTYLVPNIVLCFFTCLILGIPGIVFSALAISSKNKGDIEKAVSRASTAKTFMIINAVIAGLVVLGWIGNHMR